MLRQSRPTARPVVGRRPVAGGPRRDAGQPGRVVRDRRADGGRCSHRCSATCWPPPGCGRWRRCAGARSEVSLEPRGRASAVAGRARRDPPARGDAQRDARAPRRAPSSASGSSWPTPATSCARPVAVIKAELEGALRAGGHEPRGARGAGRRRRGVRPPRTAGRGPAGGGPHGRRRAAGPARGASTSHDLLERVRRRFADRAARARPPDHGRRRRRRCACTPTSCACARRSGTSSTTRCATASGEIALRARRAARRRRARGQRPGRRASPPDFAGGRSSASRAATAPRTRGRHRPRPGDRARDRGGPRRPRGDRPRRRRDACGSGCRAGRRLRAI